MENSQCGMILKIDPTYRVLQQNSLLEFIENHRRNYRGNNFDNFIDRELNGICVLTRYNLNVYRIDGWNGNKSLNDTFY